MFTASKYVMQMSKDFDRLLSMDVQDTDWMQTEDANRTISGLIPRLAGEAEQVTFTLDTPTDNLTLFLTVRAVDDSGNAGEASNVVTLSPARELAVPLETISPAQSKRVEFWLKVIVPPTAALVLFIAVLILVYTLRHRGSKGSLDEDGQDRAFGSGLSVSTVSLDLAHMNYRHDGQYRKRQQESPETWSELGKSRESLDQL